MTVHTNPSTENSQIVPSLTVKEGRVVANSLDIAAQFERDHKNVVAAIAAAQCSEEFNRLNFQPIEYRDSRGRSQCAYEITRKGFAFLVMGFTGAKAARFKEAYIEAYERMEEELLRQRLEPLGLGRDDDELTAWGVPIRKLAIQNQTIRTILAVEGIEAARYAMRSDKTFPRVRGYAIRELVDTPRDDPQGCARHLFRFRAQSAGTVGSLLDLALRDESARSALRTHGIIVDPGGRAGFVAFADSHPFLRRAFEQTQWAGEWNKALIFLDPRAVRTKKTLPFNGCTSTAVLVPREAIVNLRNSGVA